MNEAKGSSPQFAGAGFVHRVAKLIQSAQKCTYATAKTRANNLLGQPVIVNIAELPTSAAGLNVGEIWNDGGSPVVVT